MPEKNSIRSTKVEVWLPVAFKERLRLRARDEAQPMSTTARSILHRALRESDR